jgi:nucleoside-diphosphate-sugar epimerase
LRIPGALDQFDDQNVTFVFFLACEVGGSKFINSVQSGVQQNIIKNNLLIYQTVIPWLQKKQIPFVFTSSYLQTEQNSYGAIKRLGEVWMETLQLGRVARLWNIYGLERQLGERSHVITDWIASCVNDKHISAHTNGAEARQFLHAEDCAAALGTMMVHFKDLSLVTDVSLPVWTSLSELGTLITATGSCSISYSDKEASARLRTEPNIIDVPFHKLWKPQIRLEAGVRRLFTEYGHSHDDL